MKVKTVSAAKKRFRKTGGKDTKIKRSKAYKRHLLTKKTEKLKRHLRQGDYVCKADFKNILAMLPY